MITFNLRCENDHTFEGWFSSSKDFEKQLKNSMIACPVCGSTNVEKGLSAPSIIKGKGSKNRDSSPKDTKDPAVEMKKALYKLAEYVYTNCENVGERFPEEARKIYYGESEKRGIYGKATPEEERELREEGIEVMKIPALPKFDQ